MSLLDAHKGYEYQDLFSAYHVLNSLLINENVIVKIDQKESREDKFDDLTIITDQKITKRQIKYSDSKLLEKKDLSSLSYDLALDILYKSWASIEKNKQVDIRLCLAWEFIANDELNFLKEIFIDNPYNDSRVRTFIIDLEEIWPEGEYPISSWKRLRNEVIDKAIEREDFKQFLTDLKIELNLPKSNLQLDAPEPDSLEQMLFKNLRLFGVGKYPNDQKTVVDIALRLIHLIKISRSNGDTLDLNKIIYNLGLIRNYGNINQTISIDKTINVYTPSKYETIYDLLNSNYRISLLGSPGSGKSWFVQNFKEFLYEKDIKIIEHYCYTGVNDTYEKERITTNVFLANLINDILVEFPDLKKEKSSIYGVDVEELQELINKIDKEVVLIVDGLDHIGRVYSLHEETMKRFDTQIVKIIAELSFPENVKVLLVSQPYNEVLDLQDSNFTFFEIPSWNIEEIQLFMNKSGLTDIDLNFNDQLSSLLYTKSNGNPLYLTYLVNELNNYTASMISKEMIDSFPPYDNMLENYYTYLMSKIKENSAVPRILAGSPFSLSSEELKEITGEGIYVDSDLIAIRSILSFNSCSGGYVIYHESFRRFTLNILEEKQLSIERLIYNPLVDWLTSKGIYENKKAYLNLLVLLFEHKRYEEILKYCNKEFVIESVFKGHSISSLKKNFDIIIKSAAKDKNYESLIRCTELSEMIRSFEDAFEENIDDYFMALGVVNGFDYLKESLLFEGKTTLPYAQGLKVCYMCSINNVIPDWEPYIEELRLDDEKMEQDNTGRTKNEELVLFKYFICGCLDMGKDLSQTIKYINEPDDHDFRMITIAEYDRRNNLDEFQQIIKSLGDENFWAESFMEYLGNEIIEQDKVLDAFNAIQSSKTYSDEVLNGVSYYVNNIEWLIENHLEELEGIKEKIKNINWYFNWIIFVFEINKVVLRVKSGELSDSELIKSYSLLLEDTEIFKGEPRTCDLYAYQQIIFNSILTPLQYVNQEEVWRDIICRLETLSMETTSTLDGTPSGPFPIHKLIELLLYIENEINSEFVLEVMDNSSKVDNQKIVYSFLAEISLKHTIALANQNKEREAKIEFLKSTQFLLAYGYRKDRTLSRLIDSVGLIYKINEVEGVDRLKRLKRLADNVVLRTDGRSTKRYPIEWFEGLADCDINLAFEFLSYCLVNYDINWNLEEMFDCLLEKISGKNDSIVENVLYKTRPGNVDYSFLNGYLANIETLISDDEEIIAKKSIQDILNRLDSEPEIDKVQVEKIIEIVKSLGIDYDFETLIAKQKVDNDFRVNNEDPIKEKVKTEDIRIEQMSNEDLLEFSIKNEFDDDTLKEVIQYLSRIENLTPESKMFINSFVKNSLDKALIDKKKIATAFSTVSSTPSIMAYINMSIYLHIRGSWYEKFTETSYFTKAFEYDSKIAEDYFFEYFYNEFSVGDFYFSAGDEIINALESIKYNESELINYWDSLFEIIEFRLPGRYDYNFDEHKIDLEDLNEVEKMLFLLLIRFRYGEAKRYKFLASGLDLLLSKEEYRIHLIKPLNLFIDHSSKFPDYSMIIILSNISKWFTENEIIDYGLSNSLTNIDSSGNKAIEYLVKKNSGARTIRMADKYIVYQDKISPKVNDYLEDFINKDQRIKTLLMFNTNVAKRVVHEFGKTVFNEENKEKMQHLVYDNSYNIYIENVYFYDVMTTIIANEIDNYLNYLAQFEFETEDIETDLFETIVEEVDYLVATINSLVVRPKDIDYIENIQEGAFDYDANLISNEWCRVAHIERSYHTRKMHSGDPISNMNISTVISVIGYNDSDHEMPIIPLNSDYKIFDENLEDSIFIFDKKENELVTFNLNEYDDMILNFKSNYYLGIRSDILSILNIHLVDFGDGIKGINKFGDVVLKYSTWEEYFSGKQHGNYLIPRLKGADLQIEKNTFIEICKLFENSPKMNSKKFIFEM